MDQNNFEAGMKVKTNNVLKDLGTGIPLFVSQNILDNRVAGFEGHVVKVFGSYLLVKHSDGSVAAYGLGEVS